jgi:hypothetical protein
MVMAKQSNRTSNKKNHLPEDWPRLLTFAVLAVLVLGVLLLGAFLRVDSTATDAGAPAPAGPPEPAGAASRRPSPVLPASASTPARDVDGLTTRATADLARLAAAGDGWTAQLAVLCDPARVQQLVDRFGDRTAFHVLPSMHGDDACFRVCWNRYATRDEARGAADLPRELREVEPRPLPKSIAEVVE